MSNWVWGWFILLFEVVGFFMLKRSSEEKRVAPRYKIYSAIRFVREANQFDAVMEGIVIDLNEEGLKVISERPVSTVSPKSTQESEVKITIHFPDVKYGQEKVTLAVLPVWEKFCQRTGKHETGCRWRHLSLPQRLLIKHWQKYCAHKA